VSRLRKDAWLDAVDARLMLELNQDPRATVLSLATKVGLARNTVQARLARYDSHGALGSFERRIEPAALGLPLTAFITTRVIQQLLDQVAKLLAGIPEVLEVFGLSGSTDLLIRVVARDADDLYRIAGQILATHGVERTETALVMGRLVNYRATPLLNRLAAANGQP